MSSSNEIEIVRMDELLHYVCAEEVACSSWRETPAVDIYVRGVSGRVGEGRGTYHLDLTITNRTLLRRAVLLVCDQSDESTRYVVSRCE